MPGIILLGPPGSGKGTQAAKISQKYGIPIISTGDALRAQIAAKTEIGMKAKSYMEAGELVPDKIILALFECLFSKIDVTKGYLLDGFPRTVAQAEALDEILEKQGKRIRKVFFLNVPKEVLVKRIANRRICPLCATTYNMSGRKPGVAGYCDVCTTELIQREDDDPKTVSRRIDVYNAQTQPLIDYYEKKGLLVNLEGILGADVLQEQIDEILGWNDKDKVG